MVDGDVRGDGKPEAGSAGISCPSFVQSDETFEYSLFVLGRNAWAVICDRNHNVGIIRAGVELNLALAVPQAVADQVAQRSLQVPGVTSHLGA